MPAVPQVSSILASLGQAAFVWDLAAGSIAWSDNAGAVFTDIPPETLASATEFAKLIEPTRSIRSDALDQTAAGAQRRGGCLPDRIRREELDLRARDLDRGNRSLVCGARRQAGARARHRPHQ